MWPVLLSSCSSSTWSKMGSQVSMEAGTVHVVIVGGGFGGIAAASQLQALNIPFLLVDMKDSFHHNVAALRASVERGNGPLSGLSLLGALGTAVGGFLLLGQAAYLPPLDKFLGILRSLALSSYHIQKSERELLRGPGAQAGTLGGSGHLGVYHWPGCLAEASPVGTQLRKASELFWPLRAAQFYTVTSSVSLPQGLPKRPSFPTR